MKIEIDKGILEKLKKEIIDYLKSLGFFKNRLSQDIVRGNLDKIKYLYVDDLENETLISKNDEIIIDKRFVTFKKNKEVKEFKSELLPLIASQIIHKLWHAASNHSGIEGIIEENNVRKYKSLNEGITQMLSEDITGVVINKYSDIYKDYKKIAKIIKASTSINIILSSYINHDDSIRMRLNSISEDDTFYDELNRNISEISELKNRIKKLEKRKKIKTTIEYQEAFNALFKERIKASYQSLIIYIVIPMIKKLGKTKSKEYIEDILKSLKDDREVYEFFYNYLMRTIPLNKNSIIEEKEKINKTIKSFDQRQQFMYNFARDSKQAFKNKIIIIDDKGNIIYNQGNQKYPITSSEMSAMIFSELWKIEDKTIDERTIKKILIQGLTFSKDVIPIKRKIYFQGLKTILEERGIIVINSLKEIDYEEKLKIEYLEKNKVPSFENLKTLIKKFKLNTSVSISGNNIYEIINNRTQEIVENSFIKNNALFANVWVIAVSKYTQRNLYIDKMDQIFSKNIELLYIDFIKKCVKNLMEKNKIDELEIIEKYEKPYYKKIIEELFKYDSECIYAYLKQYIK